jgi:hypothetical protein
MLFSERRTVKFPQVSQTPWPRHDGAQSRVAPIVLSEIEESQKYQIRWFSEQRKPRERQKLLLKVERRWGKGRIAYHNSVATFVALRLAKLPQGSPWNRHCRVPDKDPRIVTIRETWSDDNDKVIWRFDDSSLLISEDMAAHDKDVYLISFCQTSVSPGCDVRFYFGIGDISSFHCLTRSCLRGTLSYIRSIGIWFIYSLIYLFIDWFIGPETGRASKIWNDLRDERGHSQTITETISLSW